MITSANEPSGGDHPLTRNFALIAFRAAALSAPRQIAATCLLPLPGEFRPNTHLPAGAAICA
jgi:hypothetical protein